MKKNKITFFVMELILLVLALFFVWKIFIQNVPEKRVAVILPESGDQRWDSLIKGMKQSAKENHIHLVICNTDDIENAEAEKEATILRGEAIKEQKIRIADGEARSIEVVQQALADSLVQLNKANPNASVLQLKALEAFQKAADGKATKIIIPSEIQGLAGLAAGLKGIVESDQPAKSSETVAQTANPVEADAEHHH